MRISRLALIAFFIAGSGAVGADEAPPSDTLDQSGDYAGEYLCVATAAGGVKFDATSGSWKAAAFNVKDERLILKVESHGIAPRAGFNGKLESGMSYTVKIAEGSGKPPRDCSTRGADFDETLMWFGKSGMFRCEVFATEYRFNLKEAKFQRTSPFGYVDGSGDTPNVLIGECSRF